MDIAAPIGVVMRADHPLASRPAVELPEVARYPILTQSGPLPRGADVNGTLQAFKDSAKPRLEANSIQMLKLAVMLNMGVSFFTRLGFLHEIETEAIAWRPLISPECRRCGSGSWCRRTASSAPPLSSWRSGSPRTSTIRLDVKSGFPPVHGKGHIKACRSDSDREGLHAVAAIAIHRSA